MVVGRGCGYKSKINGEKLTFNNISSTTTNNYCCYCRGETFFRDP